MLITARLTIAGVEVPVAGFRFENPPGVLGASLTVALARPELSQAPAGASIVFEIGIAPDADTAYSYVTVVGGGKLMGQDASLSWTPSSAGGKPGDTLQISGITPVADRWNKAPARPVIMYNPQYVDAANLGADTEEVIIDLDTGRAILPVLEPVENLNLWQAIARAYTKSMPMLSAAHVTTELQLESNSVGAGCGFDKVVTNLPNFPVDRVDFTIEGGFHAGVAGLTSIFEPIYFEDRNVLYILAPDRGLPAGFAPRQLGLSCVIRTQTTREPSEIINVIVLSYNLPNTGGGVAGLIPSIRLVDEDPIETAGGRTRVEVTRRLVDWKDLGTGAVVFTNEESTETRTYTIRDGVPTLISQETLETNYQFNGRLKAGHTRTILATYPDPAKPNPDPDNPTPLDSFGEVLVESNRIDWRTDYSSPEDSLMLRSVTETSGLVLVEPNTPKNDYTPILDAARTPGLIVADGSQSTDTRAIKTTIEQLRESGLNQAQIVTTIVDELKEISQTAPPVVSRTGSRSTSLGARGRGRGRNSRVVRERIIDPASIALYGIRRAAPLDVGYLDPIEARKEARRRLARISKGGRRSVSIELPGVDLSLRRGSIVRPPLRSGFDTDFIVIGFTITGRALGTPQARIDQLLNAVELV